MEKSPGQPNTLNLIHGQVRLPAFLPDATRAVVRSVDSQDLLACGVEALVMNTFHLMQHPGSTTVQELGGLHRLSGWPRPIITDSGGFQAYSLIRQNPKAGSLTSKGITYRTDGAGKKTLLTPEKSVQLQLSYGADVVICLDDCTSVEEADASQREAVERTVAWARRCKMEFQRIVQGKKLAAGSTPRLFAVVQGGGSRELRMRCAQELLEIGFDGFGYGGWPLDEQGALLTEIIAYTRELIPAEFPMHALGIGHPESILACFGMGYELFDSALPTRDARRGRLYRFEVDPGSAEKLSGKWFSYVYAQDEKYIKADRPVSPNCDCPVCRHYSLGYLYHLFKINDCLFPRLATLHNLRFMSQFMSHLQQHAHRYGSA